MYHLESLFQSFETLDHFYLYSPTNVKLYICDYIQITQVNLSWNIFLSGTIIRGTLKAPNSQLVTPISIKLLRPDGYD
jgi:hypothetical protein